MIKTHDYTNCTWGHNYVVTSVSEGGLRINVTGWGRGIKEGDYLILNNDIGTTRYCVVKIKYRLDPSDMWSAELSFSPRSA